MTMVRSEPAWAPVGGSGIAVLAGRDDERPAALRAGAMVLPLDRRVARRSAVVGLEVAVTARLLDLLPTPPTAVVVIPSEVDFTAHVSEVGRVARGLFRVDGQEPVLTVGVACPYPVTPETTEDLNLYNMHLEALPEALVESVAAARRMNLATANGNCVLLLQRFAPPKASAVVSASPNRRLPVRISGRWGLTEASLSEVPADVFEVAPDGRGITEKLAWKPTANVTAHGGTRTVDLAERCRYQRSLSRRTVLRLAALARNAAAAAGRPLTLDVAMLTDRPVVLRCRPCAREAFPVP
jgi:hypothetical protein